MKIYFVYRTFHWALSNAGKFELSEGLEHPDLPDGTGEFLDVWLMLLEKMVNPKAILDSPHVVSSKCSGIYKTYEPFDPIKYLIDIHKVHVNLIKILISSINSEILQTMANYDMFFDLFLDNRKPLKQLC